MQNLVTILFVNSIKDLFKNKSFFLLIFILAFADRGLKVLKNRYQIDLGLPSLHKIDTETARYVFEKLPGVIIDAITDYRVIAVLIGLFFVKQIISLWPSSDMRRMHRKERDRFGIWTSLTTIKWQQIVWDALALIFLCSLAGLWCLTGFFFNLILWQKTGSPIVVISLAGVVSLILPMIMAGFSYSSKLAVISKGSFREKLALFFKFIISPRIAGWSWLFYTARLILEAIFVVVIPAYILMTIDNYLLRILLATMLATPVYSYIKMASFKFFLIVYEEFPLVKQEYQSYYQTLHKV